MAEKFSFEKKLIVKELNRHGIYAILTPPEKLSINTINNHRKNMLQKMDCKTSSQLLKKIINDGIL